MALIINDSLVNLLSFARVAPTISLSFYSLSFHIVTFIYQFGSIIPLNILTP